MSKSKTEASDRSLGLPERRAFMKLPLEERRQQLAEQACQMAEHYERRAEGLEREDWQGSDIVECS
jgi:hypothetical protein